MGVVTVHDYCALDLRLLVRVDAQWGRQPFFRQGMRIRLELCDPLVECGPIELRVGFFDNLVHPVPVVIRELVVLGIPCPPACHILV